MTDEDIRGYFDAGPQEFVDLVRQRGHKLYSDRVEEDKILIR